MPALFRLPPCLLLPLLWFAPESGAALPQLALPPPPRSVSTAEAPAAVPGAAANSPLLARESPTGALLPGRLFFTPERRQLLNRLRERNSLESRIKLEPETIVTLNGVVQRSTGKRTVWVNGLPLTEGQELTDLQIRRVQGNRVQLLPGNAPLTELKVGQTLERGSGYKQDMLGAQGEIIVHRPLDSGRR